MRLLTVAPLAVGLALIAFAWSRTLPLSALLLMALGASALISVNATNALLQQSVPDEWRGRVIGLYSMSFAGTAPIGGLLAGFLAERIGLDGHADAQRRSDCRGRPVRPLAAAQPPRGPARADAQPEPLTGSDLASRSCLGCKCHAGGYAPRTDTLSEPSA